MHIYGGILQIYNNPVTSFFILLKAPPSVAAILRWHSKPRGIPIYDCSLSHKVYEKHNKVTREYICHVCSHILYYCQVIITHSLIRKLDLKGLQLPTYPLYSSSKIPISGINCSISTIILQYINKRIHTKFVKSLDEIPERVLFHPAIFPFQLWLGLER